MTAELNEYNEKRNFERTLEPEGKKEDSDEGLKFVIQHHMARRDSLRFASGMERCSFKLGGSKGPFL